VNTDRILVPVDFSDCSRLLVAEAAGLARRLGASLTLLHVVSPPEGLSAETPARPLPEGQGTSVGRYLVDAAWARLPSYVAVAQSARVPTTAQVEVGPIVPTILARAHEGHGFIVMATHGRRGLARMLMGSVADQVTRTSHLPVMTIRTEHRADCQARSCQWCAAHVMPEDLDNKPVLGL